MYTGVGYTVGRYMHGHCLISPGTALLVLFLHAFLRLFPDSVYSRIQFIPGFRLIPVSIINPVSIIKSGFHNKSGFHKTWPKTGLDTGTEKRCGNACT